MSFAKILDDLNSDVSISESHGIMTGMLCVGPDYVKVTDPWQSIFTELLGVDGVTEYEMEIISDFKDKINKQLTSEDLDFQPLLPDDDHELSFRLEELGLWAGGFLTGLSSLGVNSDDLTDDVEEMLEDLVNISNISSDASSDESDEVMFVELVEFVRIAVQNIFLDMRSTVNQSIH